MRVRWIYHILSQVAIDIKNFTGSILQSGSENGTSSVKEDSLIEEMTIWNRSCDTFFHTDYWILSNLKLQFLSYIDTWKNETFKRLPIEMYLLWGWYDFLYKMYFNIFDNFQPLFPEK